MVIAGTTTTRVTTTKLEELYMKKSIIMPLVGTMVAAGMAVAGAIAENRFGVVDKVGDWWKKFAKKDADTDTEEPVKPVATEAK